MDFPVSFRSIDGFGNHLRNPEAGRAGATLLRMALVDYADGRNAPSGGERLSARVISNACAAQDDGGVENDRGASDYLWQWGQFLDHDIDLTHSADPAEAFDVDVPTGDPFFDPAATGSQVIGLDRSDYRLDDDGVRQQVNSISAFIDASNVYGSDAERARALRTLDGSGRLKASAGDLLPFNTEGFENAPSALAPGFFLAGDIRANEQAALSCLHTLFL